MWMLFGSGAMVFALLNLKGSSRAKSPKWPGFISLSLTALTLCDFYADEAARVANSDWGGLMDIMPTMSRALWVCTLSSILINSVPLFRER